MKKITQKMMAFYLLWKCRQDNPDEYIPTWRFVGEIEVPELWTHVMMSYKCPTRLTDIYQENPDLLERKLVKGKSGAEYYAYRFAPEVNRSMIKDAKLRDFFDHLKEGARKRALQIEHETNISNTKRETQRV